MVIDGFEKIRSPIYGGLTTVVNTGPSPRWVTLDVEMWMGHSAYLEIADGAVVDFGGATSHVDDGNGWIAVDEIRTSDNPAPEIVTPHAGSQDQPAKLDLTKAIAALRDVSTQPGRAAGDSRCPSECARNAESRPRRSPLHKPREPG